MGLPSTQPAQFPLARPGSYGPPLFFLMLCAACMFGVEDAGSRVFFIVMTLLMALWYTRAVRVRVETSEEGLMVRTSYRTTRLRWAEVDGAELRPMRTASPFRSSRPYVALAVRLTNGDVRQFDDVAASASDSVGVAAVVEQINAWCEGSAAA